MELHPENVKSIKVIEGKNKTIISFEESNIFLSFNGKMRDELLNGEIFDTMAEAMVLIEGWRAYYNTVRPHSSLEYRPPAPEARVVDISLQMA